MQFDIVEQVFDKNKLIEREQYWIDFYQSYKSKNGYNISKTAGSTLGCKMPKSHLDSCKKRMLGNTFSLGRKWTEPEKKEIGARSKKMWEENPEKKKNMGEKLSKQRKGVSIWENRPHPALGKVSPCKGQKRSKEFCELMSKQRFENNGMKGIKLSKERVEQIKKQVSKPLALIDDNGNILKEYKSQREATIDLGLTKGAVSRVCKGEYKQTKGYKFKYL